MTAFAHQLFGSAAWLVLCTAPCMTPITAYAADAGNPGSYALRLPLAVTAGAPLQRLALPASALIQLQMPGYADVRVFNAGGQAVPMALAPAPHRASQRQQTLLPAYPLLGSADNTARGLDGLVLRMEERTRNGQTERVVNIDVPAAASTASSATPAAIAQTLGALLDARGVSRPAVSLVLDAEVPIGKPITFSVATSPDLAAWRPLADTVVYRAAGATSLGTSTLTFAPTWFGSEPRNNRYLRVTWADAAGKSAAVTLHSATLVTTTQATVADRLSATVAAPVLSNPHTVSFSLPFAAPVAALQVRPEGSNVVVPLRVLGRVATGQPWQPLASTVVYSLQSAGKLQTSDPVALPGSSAREIKLEADLKTPGFAAPPEITVFFEPVNLVFVATGPAPFTLAVGLNQAANAWLPLASIVPVPEPGPDAVTLQVAALPLAVVAGHDGITAVAKAIISAAPVSDGPPTRSLVLWGVLVAGALMLALMAWALLRQKPADAPKIPDA